MNLTELTAPPAEYDFERLFDERRAFDWMQENWYVGPRTRAHGQRPSWGDVRPPSPAHSVLGRGGGGGYPP